MKRVEIEEKLRLAMLEGVITKKDYVTNIYYLYNIQETKVQHINSQIGIIESVMGDPEAEKALEIKLGLVSEVREVQNMA